LIATKRFYALPFSRAFVTQVSIENLTNQSLQVGVVELYDVNVAQFVAPAPAAANRSTLQALRDRRQRAAQFRHTGNYEPSDRIVSVATMALQSGPVFDQSAQLDDYPPNMWLAPLSAADIPDAAWLQDAELWPDARRDILPRVNNDARNTWRNIDFLGAKQPGVMGLRVPMVISRGGSADKSFVFGFHGPESDAFTQLFAIREQQETRGSVDPRLIAETWRDRLNWASFPSQPNAAAVQREAAWSSYSLLAMATFNSALSRQSISRGGALRFIDGIEGSIAEMAQLADALTLLDPALAADTLDAALSSAAESTATPIPFRLPLGFTGFGNVADTNASLNRTDGYLMLPAMVGRYVQLTGDVSFLQRSVPKWPYLLSDGGANEPRGFVWRQLARAPEMPRGALGLMALGSGDSSSGVLATSRQPLGTDVSSTVNAGYTLLWSPLVRALQSLEDSRAVAEGLYAIQVEQSLALQQLSSADFVERAFADNGTPLGTDNQYAEPRILLAQNLEVPERLFDVTQQLGTSIGLQIATPFGSSAPVIPGDPDVNVVDLRLTSLMVDAWLARDSDNWVAAWQQMVSASLFSHATQFPALWYGVWTGPGKYQSPTSDCPGCAAGEDVGFPALNAFSHGSLLSSVRSLAGVGFDIYGFLQINPSPSAGEFSVQWPTMSVQYTRTTAKIVIERSRSRIKVRIPDGIALDGRTPRLIVNGRDTPVFRDEEKFLLLSSEDFNPNLVQQTIEIR
jgi:hypothetical protein